LGGVRGACEGGIGEKRRRRRIASTRPGARMSEVKKGKTSGGGRRPPAKQKGNERGNHKNGHVVVRTKGLKVL